MVQLHQRRVLQRVAPRQVAVIRRVAVEGVEQFGARRSKADAHVRELVVDQAGVQAGDQRAAHGRREDERRQGGRQHPECAQPRRLQRADVHECGFRVAQEAVLAQD